MFFQQDGCPAHNYRRVRRHLRRVFGNRVICNNGPIDWPPRSPDLTPLDFFLWGCLKNQVYAMPVESLDDLKARIVQACENITPEMIREALGPEMRRRMAQCVENHGGHIEHLL